MGKPGNEKAVAVFILRNRRNVELKHIGLIETIKAPTTEGQFIQIRSETDLRHICIEDSGKKADILINEVGVSIKQKGSSFSYNRLQRASIEIIFNMLGFENIQNMLQLLDKEVLAFHEGRLDRRNRQWDQFFSEQDFRDLTEFLMMKGSVTKGPSQYPAKVILEAPPKDISLDNIEIYNFDEYFERYKNALKIAIRRSWIGQKSETEHKRALGLAKKPGNAPWVFEGGIGNPSSGWREDYPPNKRKTAYYLMIEKESAGNAKCL